jgi:hypothetical protein
MNMRFLAAIALLLVATSASAADMRYPATGAPAVTFKVPDGWTAKEMDGKMVVESPDISTVVTLFVEPWSDSLDALAAITLKDEKIAPLTADDRHNVSVLDRHGVWWKLTPTATQKSRPQALVGVMLDDHTALTGLLVSPDDEGPGYHAGLHLLDRLAMAH